MDSANLGYSLTFIKFHPYCTDASGWSSALVVAGLESNILSLCNSYHDFQKRKTGAFVTHGCVVIPVGTDPFFRCHIV